MFDLAIVGSGFGGALTALIARRLGRSVILLERGRHPRFAIGESSTPLANLLWEELARRYALPRLLPLSNWGDWQRSYPEIGCGLKRGFTFYHHQAHKPFSDPLRTQQLLVGASPEEDEADTHWYRPDFDHFIVREAERAGVEFVDQVRLERIHFTAASAELEGQRGDKPFHVRAKFVLDASGPRGFLHRALGLGEQPLPAMPPTEALFSHFEAVKRLEDLIPFMMAETPPFPIDDAAVHHVFDQGWIWVLRFNNGITSAGVAATRERATQLGFAEGAPAWQRLLDLFPSVQEQFQAARPTLPFVHATRLSFRTQQVAGPHWALLPSAAGFVDPLLSSGFPLTLFGVQRFCAALEQHWGSPSWAEALEEYSFQTLTELDLTATLVGSLYANMERFEVFAAVTLLYFSAAIYAETARRHGEKAGVSAFLLHDHPQFGPDLRACLQRLLAGVDAKSAPAVITAIQRAIEPIDLAGLGNPARRNWHPAEKLCWKNSRGIGHKGSK